MDLNTLRTQADKFKKKAETYREKGEVEGSLINYLLAANNYNNCKNARGDATTTDTKNIAECMKYIIPLQRKLQEYKIQRNKSNNDDKDVNCEKVDLDKKGTLKFEHISGQQTAKDQLKQGLLYPLLYPALFPYVSKGVLFYGPPGTGKTLLAKAFANELQDEAIRISMDEAKDEVNKDKKAADVSVKILFYAPSGGSLKGKYVGETEKNIEKYFKCASEAATACEASTLEEKSIMNKGKLVKTNDPLILNHRVISVLFLDEVEAIAGDRESDPSGLMTNSVNTLLQMMDGVSSYSNVVVMAATNYPWNLDPAILRRFDTKIYISPPTVSDALNLMKIQIGEYIEKSLTDLVAKQEKIHDKSKTKHENACKKGEEANEENKLCCDHPEDSNPGDNNTNKPTIQDIYDIFQNRYFKGFSDRSLEEFIKSFLINDKKTFTGGDIKNVCRYVFKVMGDRSRVQTEQFASTSIIDIQKLRKDPVTKAVTINGTYDKQYLLFNGSTKKGKGFENGSCATKNGEGYIILPKFDENVKIPTNTVKNNHAFIWKKYLNVNNEGPSLRKKGSISEHDLLSVFDKKMTESNTYFDTLRTHIDEMKKEYEQTEADNQKMEQIIGLLDKIKAIEIKNDDESGKKKINAESMKSLDLINNTEQEQLSQKEYNDDPDALKQAHRDIFKIIIKKISTQTTGSGEGVGGAIPPDISTTPQSSPPSSSVSVSSVNNHEISLVNNNKIDIFYDFYAIYDQFNNYIAGNELITDYPLIEHISKKLGFERKLMVNAAKKNEKKITINTIDEVLEPLDILKKCIVDKFPPYSNKFISLPGLIRYILVCGALLKNLQENPTAKHTNDVYYYELIKIMKADSPLKKINFLLKYDYKGEFTKFKDNTKHINRKNKDIEYNGITFIRVEIPVHEKIYESLATYKYVNFDILTDWWTKRPKKDLFKTNDKNNKGDEKEERTNQIGNKVEKYEYMLLKDYAKEIICLNNCTESVYKHPNTKPQHNKKYNIKRIKLMTGGPSNTLISSLNDITTPITFRGEHSKLMNCLQNGKLVTYNYGDRACGLSYHIFNTWVSFISAKSTVLQNPISVIDIFERFQKKPVFGEGVWWGRSKGHNIIFEGIRSKTSEMYITNNSISDNSDSPVVMSSTPSSGKNGGKKNSKTSKMKRKKSNRFNKKRYTMKNKIGGSGLPMTQIMKNCTEMTIGGDGILTPTNLKQNNLVGGLSSSNQSGGDETDLNRRFIKINFSFDIDLFREAVDTNQAAHIRPSTDQERLQQFTDYQLTGKGPEKKKGGGGILNANK